MPSVLPYYCYGSVVHNVVWIATSKLNRLTVIILRAILLKETMITPSILGSSSKCLDHFRLCIVSSLQAIHITV